MGKEEGKRTRGVAFIANDGSSMDFETGNYEVALMKDETKYKPGIWRQGRVHGFRRKTYGAWDLLFLCLSAALGEKRCTALLKQTKP